MTCVETEIHLTQIWTLRAQAFCWFLSRVPSESSHSQAIIGDQATLLPAHCPWGSAWDRAKNLPDKWFGTVGHMAPWHVPNMPLRDTWVFRGKTLLDILSTHSFGFPNIAIKILLVFDYRGLWLGARPSSLDAALQTCFRITCFFAGRKMLWRLSSCDGSAHTLHRVLRQWSTTIIGTQRLTIEIARRTARTAKGWNRVFQKYMQPKPTSFVLLYMMVRLHSERGNMEKFSCRKPRLDLDQCDMIAAAKPLHWPSLPFGRRA